MTFRAPICFFTIEQRFRLKSNTERNFGFQQKLNLLDKLDRSRLLLLSEINIFFFRRRFTAIALDRITLQ